jgi:hypothetical protein
VGEAHVVRAVRRNSRLNLPVGSPTAQDGHMAEIKTTANSGSVDAFLEAIEDPVRRADGIALKGLFERATEEPAVMWGPAIVGFGSFEYTGRASGGQWMTVGYSPRKAALSLYGLHGAYEENGDLVEALGKHTTGKGCVYVKKLSDIDLGSLEKLIRAAMERDPNA